MVHAIILAVVGAKTNAGAAGATTVNELTQMMVLGRTIPIAECWGNKNKMRKLLGLP